MGIAFSDPSNSVSLGISCFLIGLGPGVQLCVQPVAGLFPDNSGAVLTSFSGAFQISGLMLLELTNPSESRKASFIGFSVCLFLLMVISFILYPKGKSFTSEDDDSVHAHASHKEGSPNPPSDVQNPTIPPPVDALEETQRSGATSDNKSFPEETKKNDGDPIKRTRQSLKEPPTLASQLKNIEYILLVGWFSVLLVPLQYYIGSIGFQLEERGDDDGFYTELYTIMYASAVVVSPVGGYLSDRLSLGATQGVSTILCSVSFFVLASKTISLNAHVLGFICYGIGRMFVFGSFFANVGKRLGYFNFGTLAGLGLLLSAIVGTLQYPLISLAADGSSTQVNNAAGAVLLCLLPYCFWLHRKEKSGYYE